MTTTASTSLAPEGDVSAPPSALFCESLDPYRAIEASVVESLRPINATSHPGPFVFRLCPVRISIV